MIHQYLITTFVCHVGVLQYYHFLYISVYDHHGYIETVDRLAQLSMQAAVEEVQALSEYLSKVEVHAMYYAVTSCNI